MVNINIPTQTTLNIQVKPNTCYRHFFLNDPYFIDQIEKIILRPKKIAKYQSPKQRPEKALESNGPF